MADRDITDEIARAYKLHLDGATIRAIADELGIAGSTAHARVRAALDTERVVGDAEDRRAARAREAAALDGWAEIAEQHARSAEDPIPAVRALTALSARRSRLLGLDAPTRVNVTDDRPAPQPDPEIRAAVQRAQAEAARQRAALRGEPAPADDEGVDYGAA